MSNRLNFLLNHFKIINGENIEFEDSSNFISDGENYIAIRDNEDEPYKFTNYFFNKIVSTDPTSKKIYTQWLLNVFNKLLNGGRYGKHSDHTKLLRLFNEDLSLIHDNIIEFDGLKKTKRYRDICKNNISISHILDPTNIYQFETIEELYDSLFPLKDRDVSALEQRLIIEERNGNGKIIVNDKSTILFIPLNYNGAITFNGLANWCTARLNNTMFNHYTTANKRPDNKKSKLYVLINKLHDPELDDMNEMVCQIHFETNQFKDASNRDNMGLVMKFLRNSNGVKNFFYNELKELLNYSIPQIKTTKGKLASKTYLDVIKKFGMIDLVVNLYSDDLEELNVRGDNSDNNIDLELNIKEFKKLKVLKLIGINLIDFPNMKLSKTIEIISLSNNKLSRFPDELLELKNVKSINLNHNRITDVPNNIKYLLPENGGSLINISLIDNRIPKERIDELQILFKNIVFNH